MDDAPAPLRLCNHVLSTVSFYWQGRDFDKIERVRKITNWQNQKNSAPSLVDGAADRTTMRLLFVKLKHIGDTLILTPTLTAARTRYPHAQIWVVVRKGCEDILKGCPAVDRVLTAAAPERRNRSVRDWWYGLRLIRELRAQKFDYAFELTDGDRGRFLTWLSGAKVRCTNDAQGRLNWFWRSRFNRISHFDWQFRHSVERDFYTVNDFLPLGNDIPRLVFQRNRTEPWLPGARLEDFAILHPASRWQRNRWPVEKWIAVGQWLLDRVSRLVISAGPDPEEIALAGKIQAALGERSLSTKGELSWAQLADLLYRARLVVVGDTGALHLAAACECPIVGLFRPRMVVNWHPWQVEHQVVTDPAFAPNGSISPSDRVEQQTVAASRVEDVLKACHAILSK